MPPSLPEEIVLCYLGPVAYEPAWALQREIQARLIAAKRARPPEPCPHVMLFVEHPPIYTLGKNGDAAHLLADAATLDALGATFLPIDRGGDITFHGPGQLVGYPMLDLDRFFTDIHRYLRTLEEAVIQTCACYGVTGRRVAGRTGVWVGPEGAERKVCAFGIRCSRWVTMHGLALNVDTDLRFFDYIIPCGIDDRGVTSLARETGRPLDEAAVRERLGQHLADAFGARLRRLDGEAAFDFLEAYLGEPGWAQRLAVGPRVESARRA